MIRSNKENKKPNEMEKREDKKQLEQSEDDDELLLLEVFIK